MMVLGIIHMNSADGVFNPLGNRKDIYQKLLASNDYIIGLEFFRSAIKHGHRECLQIVEEFGCPLSLGFEEYMFQKFDFIDHVIFYRKHQYQRCAEFSSMAAFYGKLECLQFFHERKLPWNPLTCVAAILGNNQDCLKYAIRNGCPINTPEPIEAAAYMGNLSTIQLLYKQGCPWSIKACNRAARKGHLECLKFMRANGCPWSVKTVIAAVKGNNFDCLKYLVDSGCPVNSGNFPGSAVEEAAYLGNLTCLKYLREHGSSWSEKTCDYTATQVESSITYAHMERPIDAADCEDALKDIKMTGIPECRNVYHFHDLTCFNEQRECLTYAWMNGAPWDLGTCNAGSGDGRMDCLLNEPDHNCMWDEDKFEGYAAVVRQTRPITSALLVPLLLKANYREPIQIVMPNITVRD